VFLKFNFIDRIKLPFRKDKELYAAFREILGFYPQHIKYYKLALLHKSASNRDQKGAPEHNERLEFLGDAILEAITSDLLYHRFKGQREGFLTNTRSKLVQRDTLNQLSREMGLDRLIRSNSHSTTHNSYMGGNAFEALVGAIYLDRGYDACMYFMRNRILGQLVNLEKVAKKEVNFKSKLIEWAQKNRMQLEFRIIEEQRENRNSPVFVTRVVIEGLDCESGKGYSKKESHQNAARETLKVLKSDKQLLQAIFDAKAVRTAQEEEPVALVPEA
jgi:ribonuclease-3